MASASLISATAFVTAKGLLRALSDESAILNSTTVDRVITVVMLACIALLEVIQLVHYRTTIWGRVSFTCQCVREQALNRRGGCFMRFKEILANIGVSVSNSFYYEGRLGQFSLLDPERFTYGFKSRCTDTLCYATKSFASLVSHLINRRALNDNGRDPYRDSIYKPGKSIKSPAEVKEAVVQFLERTAGKLKNGLSSLDLNGANHLLWALRYDMHLDSGTSRSQKTENQVYVILTWHIATCVCEMRREEMEEGAAAGELKVNLGVATVLSKYCAYLVASAPKLLPGHHYDTTRVFEVVVGEARRYRRRVEMRQGATRNLAGPREPSRSKGTTIFWKGARLSQELEKMEEGARWKLLADFWAEMVLCIAPSDNVREHIECLTKGGEFVTYLWALLSHAGILNRNAPQAGSV